MQRKTEAYEFLRRLEARLNARLPPPETIRSQVSAVWAKPKSEKTPQEQLACKENVFLYHFALPEIFDEVCCAGLTPVAAAEAIRCEYYGKFPQFSSSNAYRRNGHPFSKKLAIDAETIMATWRKPVGSLPINQAYPDLCLFSPLPFRIVFDAKFFEQQSLAAAEKALVEGVYEACFYRGLPYGSEWLYDYGCLLAYDASDGAQLQSAWQSVTQKSLFWADANVFVMIIRGKSQPA